MQHYSDSSYPSDICLLLRTHGEHFWLSCQVLPLLRQLESACPASEDERAAALAYLEVLWLDAKCRATETDSALAELLRARTGERRLQAEARRYHAAVCTLRMTTSARVRNVMERSHDGHTRERAAL
jgi:hypothetical protein